MTTTRAAAAPGPDDPRPPAPPRQRRIVLPVDLGVASQAVGALLGGLTTDDGTPTPLQRRLLADLVQAFRSLRGLPPIDLDAVDPLEPDQAAAAIADPALRRQLVLALIVAEQLLHPLPDSLRRRVEAYADALGVHPDALKVSRDLAGEHLLVAYEDMQRMSWYRERSVDEALAGRLGELVRSKLAYYGIGEDHHIAARWRSLADQPEGSWGRGVADFYRAHGFPYPGEPHGIYEIGAHHDFIHVLADYPTSPEGEIDVFAFIAGTMDDERGFMQFAFTLALFQNASVDRVGGLKVAIARADTLSDPGAPERLADAFRRAAACQVDVMAGIDHFAWAPYPLDEVRQRFGVVPKAVDGPGFLAG